ncbi:hypothetical protein C8R46DRAFT_1059013 [Mycena filopes]|nr:hypothetical protein C8R46DRAFT_1059013 [Mycena filopes]
MSVQELQTRIDKISVEIELQREVLRRLDQSKSAIQRQLNSIRDPMGRLPLELSSEIFVQCALPTPEAHTVLLGVCHAWTDIAVSTPTLWSSIDLDFPGVEILQLWLERTRNHPLSISLRHYGACPAVIAVLSRYAPQLKHLKIYECVNLSSLSGLGALHFLETLWLTGVRTENGEPIEISLAQILSLLRLAPNLVRCIWRDLYVWPDADPTPAQIVPLPRLLSFTEGTDLGDKSGADALLPHLFLPGLEMLALSLSDTCFRPAQLTPFLTCNLPPLKRLSLGIGIRWTSLVSFYECLRLVPSLSELEMYLPDDWLSPFFSALSKTTPQGLLLPALSKLKIHGALASLIDSVDAVYLLIFRALEVRRPQLASFHLDSRRSSLHGPSNSVRDSFCRLTALGGMEIFVGHGYKNFLL